MMAKHGLWAAASLALSLTATSAQAAPDLAAANARLTALLDKNYPALDALYKDLHQHTELGMQEVRTAGIPAQHLRDAGFTVTEKVGGRSDERRGGKECVSTVRSRGSPYTQNNKNK